MPCNASSWSGRHRGTRRRSPTLATEHVDRCYAIAYRILRDPQRAQDATQQALLSAWRDLPTLRDLERFDAWLHRLVVHACYVEGAQPSGDGSPASGSSPIDTSSTRPTWRAPSSTGTSSSTPSAG